MSAPATPPSTAGSTRSLAPLLAAGAAALAVVVSLLGLNDIGAGTLGNYLTNETPLMASSTLVLVLSGSVLGLSVALARRGGTTTTTWLVLLVAMEATMVAALLLVMAGTGYADYLVFGRLYGNGVMLLLLVAALLGAAAVWTSRADRTSRPGPATPSTADRRSPSPSTGGKAIGAALGLGGAIAVFAICSVVQAVGGSTMFSASFADPGNPLLEVLMQVTFWPGWLVTAALAVGGLYALVDND